MLMTENFPIGLNVDWSPASKVSITDHYLRNWLLDTSSLTERIEAHCRVFSVFRLGQGRAALSENEKLSLEASSSSTHYEVREVILIADEQPWVFARSVVPETLTSGEWKHLGNRPLGKLLFNDARFERGEFEVAKITSEQLSNLPIEPASHDLYGRRSLFTQQQNKVLVAEVFLPASPVYKGFRP